MSLTARITGPDDRRTLRIVAQAHFHAWIEQADGGRLQLSPYPTRPELWAALARMIRLYRREGFTISKAPRSLRTLSRGGVTLGRIYWDACGLRHEI